MKSQPNITLGHLLLKKLPQKPQKQVSVRHTQGFAPAPALCEKVYFTFPRSQSCTGVLIPKSELPWPHGNPHRCSETIKPQRSLKLNLRKELVESTKTLPCMFTNASLGLGIWLMNRDGSRWLQGFPPSPWALPLLRDSSAAGVAVIEPL